MTAVASASTTSGWWPSTLLQYKVDHKLGEGAASTIWAVHDPATKKKYAIKHVLRKTDKDLRYIEQIQNEFVVSNALNSPYLRKSIELKLKKTFFIKINEAFLVMEWCDGMPLDKQPPGSVANMVKVMTQVARGLDTMHLAGYVHCDMKPSNILSTEDLKVKVIDFGQACKIGTVKERIQGTPDFIAPEQVEKRAVTVKTDIFNYGASLYFALSKHKVPTFVTMKKSKRAGMRDEDIAPPTTYDPTIPKELSDVVMDCIKIDPIARPKGMSEVIRRLDAIKLPLK